MDSGSNGRSAILLRPSWCSSSGHLQRGHDERAFWNQGLFWLVYLCVFVACAVIMIAILCLMDRWGAYRMELFYRAAFAFGVVGSAALPLAYNHLFFSYAVIYVAYALMSAAMWLLVWSVVFMRHVPPRRVVGLVFGLQYIALPCGFGAAKLMQQLAAASASSDLLPYVGFSAIALPRRRLRVRLAGAHAAFALAAAFAALP